MIPPPPPPVPLGAPVPLGPARPPTVFYRDYFSDATKDPFRGNYSGVLQSYMVPPADAPTPTVVRNAACNASTQNIPTAFILLHDNDIKLHVYLQLERFNARIGLPPTPWDDRMFIGKGELVHNQQVVVEWNDNYFNQSNNVRVPSAALIDNAYGADPNANILGPFDAADADTEVIRVRRTCYVPPPYVSLFLANQFTPREAWMNVRGQIVNDGREADCATLINFLRCAITRSAAGAAPTLAQTPPTAPLADELLLTARRQILERDFPALNTNLPTMQQNAIAGQLSLLVDENREARRAEDARRARESVKTPLDLLGTVGLYRLLRFTNVQSAAGLSNFWTMIANTKKHQHLSSLQWEVNRIKAALQEQDLQFIVSASLLEVAKNLQWEMTSNDNVSSGLNPFLLPELAIDEALGQQAVYEMMHSDGAAPSLNDAAIMVKAKAGAPRMIYQAQHQIRRFEILLKVLLGENHPVPTAINAFANRMRSQEARLHLLLAENLLLPTMLVKKVAVLTSTWFKRQAITPAVINAPNYEQMFDDMDEERPWQPVMSTAFLTQLGLHKITQVSPPTPPVAPSPLPVPSSDRQSEVQAERLSNTTFNETLFGKIKDSKTTCREVRSLITKQELPQLPLSKVDNLPMCLAWHGKGQCNSKCGRRADHVSYTSDEYQRLVQWTNEHFPTE